MQKPTHERARAVAVIMARTELKCRTKEAEAQVDSKPELVTLGALHYTVRYAALRAVDAGKIKIDDDEKFAKTVQGFRDELVAEEQYLTQARTPKQDKERPSNYADRPLADLMSDILDGKHDKSKPDDDILSFVREVFGADVLAEVIDLSPNSVDARISELIESHKTQTAAKTKYDSEREAMFAVVRTFGEQVDENTWRLAGRKLRITVEKVAKGVHYTVERDENAHD